MRLQDFLNKKTFSLRVDGRSILLPEAKIETLDRNRWNERYVAGGLTITREVTCYPEFDAIDWVLWLSNEGDERTGLVTELLDCDIVLPFPQDQPLMKGFRPYDPDFKVINAIGGANSPEDFTPREFFLTNGESKEFRSEGGRSSSPLMPYIEMLRGKEGVIASVGWSGDWKAVVARREDVVFQAGIPDLEFRLEPGEKIRTIRTVLMAYDGSCMEGHNKFRRFVKKKFSLMGTGRRPVQGPLSMSLWGGVDSRKCIDRIRMVKKYNLGIEYIWMDAGWYGNSTLPCPDEHSGDWGIHAGSWNINPSYHPDGLKEVADEIKKAGMKFILWCEPERAITGTQWVVDHPGWFIESCEPGRKGTVLLDLGNPEARQACIDLIDRLIRELDLDCYRQDFNLDPASFWINADTPERRGITQIKHIMGLYDFWDTLLERHPELFIDNCASGGRRLDIELMRRSMPLWETDYTCTWNYDAEDVQSQNAGVLWWLPYTGTGTGSILGDTYRFRSSYASSLVCASWGYDFQNMDESEAAIRNYDWARKHFSEYKRTRTYFTEDYYPVTMPSLSKDVWSIMQFDRPEHKDGMIIAFRRSNSSMSVAKPELHAMAAGFNYRLEDADTGNVSIYSAEDLASGDWELAIENRGESRLIFYRAVL